MGIYIAGRIVSSHVHVSTLRRTWSTQKLIFTGLASGGISRWSKLILLYNCSRRRTLGLELVGGGVYGRKGFGKVQVEDMAVRRTVRLPQHEFSDR